MTEATTWTEERIAQLKGQEESIRLEFKAGALFDKPHEEWLKDLSGEISGFANTEGGTLILGLKEEKVGKLRVAGDPDGIAETLSKEQLQRLIDGNLSP